MESELRYPFRRLQDLLIDLVDPQVGIIKFVKEHPCDSGAPELFRYVARAADTRGFGCVQNFANSGGAAVTRDGAIAKALGEALERYSSAIYSREELPLTSYKEAPFPCVHPSEFAVYEEQQYDGPDFMFRPFREDTPARWVKAHNLATGEPAYVPAGFVYLPYHYPRNEEPPLAQPISTGLACHCSLEEAIIGGLCEVIERDAFTVTWQAELSRARIRTATLSAANRDLVERYRRVGYDVYLVDVTSDTGVATVMAVLRGASPEALPLAVATSADLDPETAVGKALEELAHTERHSVGILKSLKRIPDSEPLDAIDSQAAHLNYWCSADRAHLVDFLYSATEEISFADLPNLATGDAPRDLALLSGQVAATGHTPMFVDVTSPDLRSLGLCVVRALIPGFHPLVMGYKLRATGGRRLWTLPKKLGVRGRGHDQGDYPYPHPFP